jgi:hypothetical protein
MHSLKLLIALAVIQTSCVTLPDPPKGYLYRRSGDVALCSELGTGATCPMRPLSTLPNVYMISFPTWEEIQNYQDALIRAAKRSM